MSKGGGAHAPGQHAALASSLPTSHGQHGKVCANLLEATYTVFVPSNTQCWLAARVQAAAHTKHAALLAQRHVNLSLAPLVKDMSRWNKRPSLRADEDGK